MQESFRGFKGKMFLFSKTTERMTLCLFIGHFVLFFGSLVKNSNVLNVLFDFLEKKCLTFSKILRTNIYTILLLLYKLFGE